MYSLTITLSGAGVDKIRHPKATERQATLVSQGVGIWLGESFEFVLSIRLGVWSRIVNMKAHWTSPDTSVFVRGMKRYELSNHLGNVLAVVSDRRTGVDSTNDGNVDYYTAQVLSAQDYYPEGRRKLTMGLSNKRQSNLKPHLPFKEFYIPAPRSRAKHV